MNIESIDTNCNNCKFMERDMDKFKQSVLDHRRWENEYVANRKSNMLRKANDWDRTSNKFVNSDPLKCEEFYNKALNIRSEAAKINPNYTKPKVNYGSCTHSKWDHITVEGPGSIGEYRVFNNKQTAYIAATKGEAFQEASSYRDVSFIPMTCIPENQGCYVNRNNTL